MEDAVKKQIETLISQHPVMLFMKGSKSFPQCGFSSAVVNILKETGVEFGTANVLSDPALRDGIKVYSDWPTIPQLYINGEFVGGCDIVREMHASGELATALGLKAEPPRAPKVTLSASAARAFKDAAEPGDDKLRLEIDREFKVDLYFAPEKPGDVTVLAGGVSILMDAATAKRADGISIDFVESADGAGFKIDNPNAPPQIRALSPRDLAAFMKDGEPLHLFDVRTQEERNIARIEGAILFDDKGRATLEGLDKSARIVFHCHHGVRSLSAADFCLKLGFRRVYNLTGGIDAWSQAVDSKVARY